MEGRVRWIDNRPWLQLELDGVKWDVNWEQAMLGRGYDVVFIHHSYPGSFRLPADPGNGRPEASVFQGFTDDEGVVELVKLFLERLEAGGLEEGPLAT